MIITTIHSRKFLSSWTCWFTQELGEYEKTGTKWSAIAADQDQAPAFMQARTISASFFLLHVKLFPINFLHFKYSLGRLRKVPKPPRGDIRMFSTNIFRLILALYMCIQADKLLKIQKNLDDIKDIMHKNIDEVLKRGENLDSLMEKSEDLSATSVQFYKKAKSTNACCKY